jgi:hypothetical protein
METSFFETLQNHPISLSVGENWFPWIESLHVVAICLFAGSLFVVDTRLLGLASKHLRFSYLSNRILPMSWLAFAFAVMTGVLMFMANATGYIENKPLLTKFALILVAGLNMLWFQFVIYRSVSQWDAIKPPTAARAAGAISITLWVLVVALGRWAGFV